GGGGGERGAAEVGKGAGRTALYLVRAALATRAARDPQARDGLLRYQLAGLGHTTLHDAGVEPRVGRRARLGAVDLDAALHRHARSLRPRLRAARGAQLVGCPHRSAPPHAGERPSAPSPEPASRTAV